MTEEASADDEEPGDDGGERSDAAEDLPDEDGQAAEDDRPSDEDLAAARSEEEPDVEAAKEELEAIGRDQQNEDGDEEPDADDAGGLAPEDSDPEAETAAGPAEPSAPRESEAAEEASDPAAESPEETEEEDEVNPEDLVRDPDEPQVTSSLDAEAAEAGAEAESEATSEPEADGETGDAAGETEDSAVEADSSPEQAADETAAADADGAETGSESEPDADSETDAEPDHQPGVPDDVAKYDRFKKVDGAQYERVNEFLRDRTYITAREWAIARLCSDFRTETGVEMTKIGENLPELVPFMTDTYTAQAVNQARASFEDKVRTAGATFLYGAMCDFFTAEELDEVMYESTEVAKFLLEVEGVELSVEDELEAEDRISAVMREVRSSSAELRHEHCPECGAELSGGE